MSNYINGVETKPNKKTGMELVIERLKENGTYDLIMKEAANAPEKVESLIQEQKDVMPIFREIYLEIGHATTDGAEENYAYQLENFNKVFEEGNEPAPKYGVFLVDSPSALINLCSIIEARREAGEALTFPQELLPVGFDPDKFEKGELTVDNFVPSTETVTEGKFSNFIATDRIDAYVEANYGSDLSKNTSAIVHGGAHDAGWLSHYQFLRHIAGVKTERNLDYLDNASQGICWWAPYDNFIIMQRRPVFQTVESEERRPGAGYRLHNFDRAAVEWADGTKRFFINGIEVPEEVVTLDKDDPKLAEMYFDGGLNVEIQLCIGDKVGIENILSKLSNRVVDSVGLQKFPSVLTDLERREQGAPFTYSNPDLGIEMVVDSDTEEALPAWALDKSGKLNREVLIYELLEVTFPDGATDMFLKMGNLSEDKTHIECVGRDCSTVVEALAFRWGKEVDEFKEIAGVDAEGVFTKFAALA